MAPPQMYQMIKAHRGRASGGKAAKGASDFGKTTAAAAVADGAQAADAAPLVAGAAGAAGAASRSAELLGVPSGATDTTAFESTGGRSTPSSSSRGSQLRLDMSGVPAAAGPASTEPWAVPARPSPLHRRTSEEASSGRAATPRSSVGSNAGAADGGDGGAQPVPLLAPPPSAAVSRLRSGHHRSTSETSAISLGTPTSAAAHGSYSTGGSLDDVGAGRRPSISPQAHAQAHAQAPAGPAALAAPARSLGTLDHGEFAFGGVAAQVVFSAGPPELHDVDLAALEPDHPAQLEAAADAGATADNDDGPSAPPSTHTDGERLLDPRPGDSGGGEGDDDAPHDDRSSVSSRRSRGLGRRSSQVLD